MTTHDTDFFNPDMPPLEHEVIARLNVSGETIALGIHNSNRGDTCLFLWVPAQAEPTYFSLTEAEMIGAALTAIINRIRVNA